MSGMNERTALLGGKAGGKAEEEKEKEEKEEKLAEVELGPNGLWETAKERRQRKVSIFISVFTMFLGAVMFSITLPSMVYFYDIVEGVVVKESKPGVTELITLENIGFYTLIVAAFSFGQAIASPPFGWWFNRSGAKWPYTLGLVFLTSGSALYALSVDKWMLAAARFLVGLGAGTSTVARAHVGAATDLAHSTGAMALVAGAQAVGLVGGPAFALAFASINADLGGGFYFDKYTAPGYISAILGVINLAVVLFFFVEAPKPAVVVVVDKDTGKPQLTAAVSSPSLTARGAATAASNIQDGTDGPRAGLLADEAVPETITVPHFDRAAVAVCMYVFFCVTTSFSVFETIGAPFTHDNLGWGVEQNSLFFTLAALASVLFFVAVKPMATRIGDRWTLFVGLILMAAGLLARLHYDGPITEVQYWTSTFCLYAIGYPLASTLSYGLLSKILGPFDQGAIIGWQQVCGSIARMTGPLWAGELYSLNSNAHYVFGVAAGFSLSAALLEVLLWRRMVPHPAIEAAAEANAVASRSSLNLRLAGAVAGSPELARSSPVPPAAAGLAS